MQYSANDIAAYIINARSQADDRITQLKLQKLLYFCQAWHLAFEDIPLFSDPIEAWVHGPVVYNVYRRYSNRRWSPLPMPESVPALSEDARGTIDMVLANYGTLGAYELERMSHDDPPWQNSREGLSAHESSSNTIDLGVLKAHYKQFVE